MFSFLKDKEWCRVVDFSWKQVRLPSETAWLGGWWAVHVDDLHHADDQHILHPTVLFSRVLLTTKAEGPANPTPPQHACPRLCTPNFWSLCPKSAFLFAAVCSG